MRPLSSPPNIQAKHERPHVVEVVMAWPASPVVPSTNINGSMVEVDTRAPLTFWIDCSVAFRQFLLSLT